MSAVFTTVDPAKLVDLQKEEFCRYFEYLRAPTSAPLPTENLCTRRATFKMKECYIRSYLPGHLRERTSSTFRDQLVVPTSLRKIAFKSCHYLPAPGGHLALKAIFDTIRNRFWWPTMPTDVRTHIEACLYCQHRKSSQRPPKLLVGHRPVTRAFQCVAANLVERKMSSQGNRFSHRPSHSICHVNTNQKKTRLARLFAISSDMCSLGVFALQKHFCLLYTSPSPRD